MQSFQMKPESFRTKLHFKTSVLVFLQFEERGMQLEPPYTQSHFFINILKIAINRRRSAESNLLNNNIVITEISGNYYTNRDFFVVPLFFRHDEELPSSSFVTDEQIHLDAASQEAKSAIDRVIEGNRATHVEVVGYPAILPLRVFRVVRNDANLQIGGVSVGD